MPTFKPYEGFLFNIKDEAKRNGVKLSRQQMPKILEDLIKNMGLRNLAATQTPNMGQQSLLVLLEYVHYLHSHQVYFVKTPFAEKLMESTIELRLNDLNELKIPNHIFEICFEDDFVVDGYKVPSALVVCGLDDGELSIMKSVIEKISDGHPVVIGDGLQHLFTVRMPSPFDGGMLHTMINYMHKDNVGKNINTVIDELTDFKNNADMFKVEVKERELEKLISRIVLGIICYLNTESPSYMMAKPYNRPIFGDTQPSISLFGQDMTRDVSWHLRRGHWRFLRDERYKRTDEGHIRCVWIRSSEVNRGAKPTIPDAKVTIIPTESKNIE